MGRNLNYFLGGLLGGTARGLQNYQRQQAVQSRQDERKAKNKDARDYRDREVKYRRERDRLADERRDTVAEERRQQIEDQDIGIDLNERIGTSKRAGAMRHDFTGDGGRQKYKEQLASGEKWERTRRRRAKQPEVYPPERRIDGKPNPNYDTEKAAFDKRISDQSAEDQASGDYVDARTYKDLLDVGRINKTLGDKSNTSVQDLRDRDARQRERLMKQTRMDSQGYGEAMQKAMKPQEPVAPGQTPKTEPMTMNQRFDAAYDQGEQVAAMDPAARDYANGEQMGHYSGQMSEAYQAMMDPNAPDQIKMKAAQYLFQNGGIDKMPMMYETMMSGRGMSVDQLELAQRQGAINPQGLA